VPAKRKDLNKLIKKILPSDLIIIAIAIASAYVYWQFYLYGDKGVSALYLPETYSQLVDSLHYWKIFTPSFIHFTESHLITNLILLWYFGRIIGSVSNRWLVLLIVSSAGVSNSIEWVLSGPLFGGASGVVAALVGFLAANQLIRPNGSFFVNYWLLIGFFVYLIVVSTGYFGLYSNAAHISGAAWGFLVGGLFIFTQPDD